LINFQNISSVSKYERKTLYRSWFFRIFSIIALIVLFFMNMGVFGFHGGIRWTTRAIAANLPYINILFVNVAQAVIAVFLAADFLKRDKKLDTTEVIYTRPVSNGEYVIGKTSGILALFVGLVLTGLLMGLVFNIIRPNVPVVWEAYLYYLFLITVPTLVFILGLSFLLMILIKNQAVTFVILLGYIGLTLFYFKDKMHGVLDYMAFNLPMVYSDFIGFGDPYGIIIHRLAYFLLGIGFIFATIRLLNRLPQVGRWNSINTIAFFVFFVLGGMAGYHYYSMHEKVDRERDIYLSLNNQYALQPKVDILSNDLEVEQHGKKLLISSHLLVRNRSRNGMDTLIFSLNPGFSIDSIVYNNSAVDYSKDHQILKIIPDGGLAPRKRTGFTIHYSGIPSDNIAYLDIPKETLLELKRIMVATIDKKPGIVSRDFLLLTPELVWYPVAGVRFNTKTHMPGELDFVKYKLTVTPNKGLMPVAPGAVDSTDQNYTFTPESDLNALSLVIGPFEKRTLEHEGVEYNLFLKPDHDYFSEFFTSISDTMGYLIAEEKNELEVEDLDLYYPFKRINLVEVPVQFHAYERPQVRTYETIQPEMIMMPEKGAGLNSLDFARYKFYEERNNRRRKEIQTPEQIELRQFERFLSSTFFRSIPRTRPISDSRQRGGEELIIFKGGGTYERNPYYVFPLYYSFMTGISSPEFPLFNSMLEIYLGEGFFAQVRQSFRGGLSDNEVANRALKDNSISEIFEDWDHTVTSALISQVGSFVFQALKNRVGLAEFDNFLYYYLEDHAFQEITFQQFAADFYDEFEVEIEPYFETINTKGKIPTFLISSPEYIFTRDDIGELFLIKFSMRNTGDIKGLVDVTIRVGSFGGGGGGGGQSNEENRIYEIDPGVTKDVQIVLYDKPRMMTINTLISGNIPSMFSTFLRTPLEKDPANLEEYYVTSSRELTLEIPDEYVVDNEDTCFSHVSVSHESKLKQYFDSRKEAENEVFYKAIDSDRTPTKWTPLAHSAFYGETIRSAFVSRRGEGNNVASWTTVLPEAGFYDIYVYIPMTAMYSRGDRRKGGGGGGGGRGSGGGPGGFKFADEGTIYNYVISSNEGSEEIEFRLRNIEDGWNKVGAFHFPADTAVIELSNRTNGRRVIADAVKWVRR